MGGVLRLELDRCVFEREKERERMEGYGVVFRLKGKKEGSEKREDKDSFFC